MTEEQNIAYVRGMILCAEIEMQGMIAENKQREHRGEAMAYTERNFQDLMLKYGIHHNALITNLTGH